MTWAELERRLCDRFMVVELPPYALYVLDRARRLGRSPEEVHNALKSSKGVGFAALNAAARRLMRRMLVRCPYCGGLVGELVEVGGLEMCRSCAEVYRVQG